MKKSKIAAVILAAVMSVSAAAVPVFAADNTSITDLSESGQTLIDSGYDALESGAYSAMDTGYGLASDAAADTYHGAQTVLDAGSQITDNYADAYSGFHSDLSDAASDFTVKAMSDKNSVEGRLMDNGISLASQAIRDIGAAGGDAAESLIGAHREGIKELGETAKNNARELAKQQITTQISLAGKAAKIPYDIGVSAIGGAAGGATALLSGLSLI